MSGPFADLDLSGKRALVTGAASGIGEAVASRLMQAGAAVVGVSRRGIAPSGVSACAADLSVESELDGVVDTAVARLGGLDIVVHNAGRGEWREAVDLDRAWFDDLVGLNLWAPLRICQLAHPHLARGDSSAVVMIGSIDASRPSAGAAVYGATKAGLAAATVALAKEWRPDGIRVNQIDPGLIDTPMAADAVDAVRSADAQINLVGRVGTPAEVASLVHHVVSPAGAFINGAHLRVDGGALAVGPFDLVADTETDTDPQGAPG